LAGTFAVRFACCNAKGARMNYYPHNINDFDVGVKTSKLPVVYVLMAYGSNYIKIGRTTGLKQRINNLQSGCPFNLSLWLTIKTPKSREVEKFLHARFAEIRVRGEWFNPTDKDLDDLLCFFSDTNVHIKEVRNALL
jgi:hypothetical protein